MEFGEEIIKMVGSLSVVVVLIIGVLLVMKRVMGESLAGADGSVLRILGGLRLGTGKSIVLVEVAGEVLVLGATTKELMLLTRVEDSHRIEQLRSLRRSSMPWWFRRDGRSQGPLAGRETVIVKGEG